MRRPEPQFHTKQAKLSDDFGYDWAVKLFGIKTVESLPKLERGPNKGKPKGWVHWKKALTAGYSRNYCQPVQPGTLVRAWIGEHMGSTEDGASYGHFMGRQQQICASRSLLFEAGRKQWMGEQWQEGD